MQKLAGEMRTLGKDVADAAANTEALQAAMDAITKSRSRLPVPSAQDRPLRSGAERRLGTRMDPESTDTLREGLKTQQDEMLKSREGAEEYRKTLDGLRSSLGTTTEALQLQVDTFGQSDGAIAAAKMRMDALREATQAALAAGKSGVDPALADYIDEQAAAYGRLTDRLKTMTDAQRQQTQALEEARRQQEKLRSLAADASGFRASLFMSDTDASIASQLRSAGVDANSAFGKQYAEYERASARLEEYRDLNREAWQGIGQDILNGTKPLEAVGNSLKNLAGRMLDSSIQNAADSLFGSIFGGQNGGLPIPGLTGQLGTASNPMHVTFAGGVGGAAASLLSGGTKSEGGALGAINKLVDGGGKGGSGGASAYREAIAAIESRGSGGYSALGPITASGDRAYGRYQVMGANIPSWSKAALGRSMTASDFMANPGAQDSVFNHRFGGYVSKFGERGAAQAWFGGPGSVGKNGRKDILGTSVGGYGDKFQAELAKLPKVGESAVSSANSFADATSTLTSGLGSTFRSLDESMLRIAGDFTPAFGGALQSVLDAFASGLGNKGGFSGGWLSALAGSITGGMTGAPGGGDAWAGLRLHAKGGISDRPAIFGEAGPEAAVPLPDGRSIPVTFRLPSFKAPALPSPVLPQAAAAPRVSVNINNNAGVAVTQQERQNPDGSTSIDVMIDKVVSKQIATRGSKSNAALRNGFGAAPALRNRG